MKDLTPLVDAIYDESLNIDAMQIAEALWLSQFMDSYDGSVELPPEDEEIDDRYKESLPRDVTHTVVISGSQQYKDKETEDKPEENQDQAGFDKGSDMHSLYSASFEYHRDSTDIGKRFQTLRFKQKKISDQELDEDRTAEYITNTGLFHPIFAEIKTVQKYLYLHIIIDNAPSMFLWQERVDEFVKSVRSVQVFEDVSIYELDSGEGDKPTLYRRHSKEGLSYRSALFRREKTLTLILSDIVGKQWRSAVMLKVLEYWSRYTFVTIVSMLPKRMWERTPLRLGASILAKSRRRLPKNSDLRVEYDFIERELPKSNIKIPVIPYDGDAMSYLSDVIRAQKDSWIDIRVFANPLQEIKEAQERLSQSSSRKVPTPLEPKTRVDNFFASAPPNARELAIYCSVLPLNDQIIKELIRVKELGDGIDAFAEFYFGGILERNTTPEIGQYAFFDGVARELRNYIITDDAKELFWILDGIIKSSLGVGMGMIDLLYIDDRDNPPLSDKEKALARLLIEILGEKGKFYQNKITNISKIIETIHLEKNYFEMGSNDGYYNDEKPIHIVTFDYDFEIAQYPVTFEEYDLFCEDTDREKPDDEGWSRGRRPVINVSWNDAQLYCDWINKKLKIKLDDKYRYRLPSEAEWEYACRAGTTTKWSFGDDEKELGEYAWYDKNSGNKTHPVGTKDSNPWGLYDMHGNVREWCEDDWADSYEKTPRDGSTYKNKNSGSEVLRGGSWYDYADFTRSANRVRIIPEYRDSDRGFRLIRTLDKKNIMSKINKEEENEKNFKEKYADKIIELLKSIRTKDLEKKVINDDSLPSDNNEALITSYDTPETVKIIDIKILENKKLKIKVNMEYDIYFDMNIFKSDFYGNENYQELYSGAENLNNHYLTVEGNALLSVDADVTIKLDSHQKLVPSFLLNISNTKIVKQKPMNKQTSKDGISFECKRCSEAYSLECDRLEWEAVDSSERNMGTEKHHRVIYDSTCNKCDNKIKITFECWEYPVGVENMRSIDSKGIKNLIGDCCPDFDKYVNKGYVENGYVENNSFLKKKVEEEDGLVGGPKNKVKQNKLRNSRMNNPIKRQIDGDFEGWNGETIIKFTNGEIWQQSEYYYHYHYAFRPNVIIYQSNNRYKMKVDGIDRAVYVKRINT